MKKNINFISIQLFLITLFLFISCIANSQNGGKSSEQVILNIRNEFSKINNNNKLKYTQQSLDSTSEEGGIIKKFYDNTDLKKVVISYYGETGKRVIEYYFKENEVIFVYEVEERYSRPITEDNSAKAKTKIENRIYFDKKKIVRWINDGKRITDEKLYDEKEAELMDILTTPNKN